MVFDFWKRCHRVYFKHHLLQSCHIDYRVWHKFLVVIENSVVFNCDEFLVNSEQHWKIASIVKDTVSCRCLSLWYKRNAIVKWRFITDDIEHFQEKAFLKAIIYIPWRQVKSWNNAAKWFWIHRAVTAKLRVLSNLVVDVPQKKEASNKSLCRLRVWNNPAEWVRIHMAVTAKLWILSKLFPLFAKKPKKAIYNFSYEDCVFVYIYSCYQRI